MPFFDLRTAVFLTGAMGALMAMVLFFLRRNYPASVQGMREWALGPLVVAASTLLIARQGHGPDVLTVVLANLVLLSGSALLVRGTYRHFARPLPRWPALLVCAGAPAIAWWTLVTPYYSLRLVVISSILACHFAGMARVVFAQPVQSFATRYTLGVLSALILAMLLRLVSATTLPAGEGLFQATFFQSLYILSLSFGLLMLTIGFVLLASERLHAELENLITHDMLTNALTRRTLFERGHAELARSQRNGHPVSALMMDLDHFKNVNDQHGHLVGDAVLRDFALRAMAQLRPADLLGRYGGEEFVVLLTETALDQARLVAERIRTSSSADPQLPPCTVSIGVATLAPGQPASFDALINQADAALYQAKHRGRNRIETLSSNPKAP
ncbi:MAG: GGDEF domain-containing protein [Burkholderiaceae bacterium]|nr:GGDEF domain-containing protein [Burkholderiaceae bacterium]